MKTNLLIEQHFHGAFGIDFNKASVDDILYLSREILKYGIGGIFPTIVTDSVKNTKHAISNIKEASQKQTSDMAKILGIHLEGIFINPEKKGIHNPKHFLAPTIENYKLIEDDFIKIVTLAPELVAGRRYGCNEVWQNSTPSCPSDTLPKGEGRVGADFSNFQLSNIQPFSPSPDTDLSPYSPIALSPSNLIDYLNLQGIKIQAGHCIGGDLSGCSGVTHLFNAMSGITHRGQSTALSALIDDNIYTEIIADGVHVSDDALRLVFKTKPLDKIILISDCLPCTKAAKQLSSQAAKNIDNFDTLNSCKSMPNLPSGHCEEKTKFSTWQSSFTFADETIYYDGEKATSKEGTLAGSTTLLPDIIKRLTSPHPSPILGEEAVNTLIHNPYKYHNINLEGSLEWDEDWNITNITLN